MGAIAPFCAITVFSHGFRASSIKPCFIPAEALAVAEKLNSGSHYEERKRRGSYRPSLRSHDPYENFSATARESENQEIFYQWPWGYSTRGAMISARSSTRT